MILGGISLCIFPNVSQMVRIICILAIVIASIVALGMQFTKDGQVKEVIDGYISVIKTEWYAKELKKQYTFLCNFIG